jgi:hypothetical protein
MLARLDELRVKLKYHAKDIVGLHLLAAVVGDRMTNTDPEAPASVDLLDLTSRAPFEDDSQGRRHRAARSRPRTACAGST